MLLLLINFHTQKNDFAATKITISKSVEHIEHKVRICTPNLDNGVILNETKLHSKITQVCKAQQQHCVMPKMAKTKLQTITMAVKSNDFQKCFIKLFMLMQNDFVLKSVSENDGAENDLRRY